MNVAARARLAAPCSHHVSPTICTAPLAALAVAVAVAAAVAAAVVAVVAVFP